ncbi:MAG: metallophosphoesterase [Clostridia bacterium]|nr:metallophosphoesterase [Clostridia bacterium]
MRKDSEVIVRHWPEPPETIDVYPVGDVHLGAAECMEKEWKDFLAKIYEMPNAYLIISGDMINNATRSGVSDIFRERLSPSQQKQLMAEMLAPVKDRILCAVPGNHEARSRKDADDDPMYDICAKLGIEDLYRENLAVVKLQMGDIEHGNSDLHPTYTLAVTHGAGGGIYTGAAINRDERFGNVIEGANVLIVGHSHKAHITKPSKLVINKQYNVVKERPYYVVGLSSWMEYGGYAARKMLLPSSRMAQVIHLGGRRNRISVTVE